MRLFWPTVDMLLEVPAWRPPEGAALRPEWFGSLGDFPRGDGAITLNTRTLEVTGGGRGVVYQQGLQSPEIAVFRFSGNRLDGDVVVRGARPAAILFDGDLRVTACIDARAAGGRAGGPGLGAHPGGGGGFGGSGGASPPAAGGSAYGLNDAFETGSGGQSGAGAGGLGGGGLQIGCGGRLRGCGARLVVDGFDGRPATDGAAGGGGSGGSLILHGLVVQLDRATQLSVRGGDGGAGLSGANGGGGGAGGFVLGVTAPEGVFDPGGAEVLAEGGRGGPAEAGGRAGEDGGCGVTFLSGKKLPPRRIPMTIRPRPARPGPWAGLRAG